VGFAPKGRLSWFQVSARRPDDTEADSSEVASVDVTDARNEANLRCRQRVPGVNRHRGCGLRNRLIEPGKFSVSSLARRGRHAVRGGHFQELSQGSALNGLGISNLDMPQKLTRSLEQSVRIRQLRPIVEPQVDV
jgi:hypothetical protein